MLQNLPIQWQTLRVRSLDWWKNRPWSSHGKSRWNTLACRHWLAPQLTDNTESFVPRRLCHKYACVGRCEWENWQVRLGFQSDLHFSSYNCIKLTVWWRQMSKSRTQGEGWKNTAVEGWKGERGQASCHRLNNLVWTGLMKHRISTYCFFLCRFFLKGPCLMCLPLRTDPKEKTQKMASPGVM